MFEIIFYKDAKGRSETADYIKSLSDRQDKESRMNLRKITAYMNALEKYGTRIGEPVTKHLDGKIWELRPLKNRFLYAYYKDNQFIILHHFIKKTRKTPKQEIDKAKKNLEDYMERKGELWN